MADIAFLDTNILVYAANEDSPYHAKAKSLIQSINSGRVSACLSWQVLVEFYATVTSPRRLSQPLSPNQAIEAIKGYLESDIPRFGPDETTLILTLGLAERYKVTGLDIFDAQIVATMLRNKVKTIYTANEEDFKRFVEIEAVNPLR
jgi:hypothetical protein